MKVAEIVSETLLEKVINENSSKTLVVDFFATWCGPCQMYIPIFDKVASKVSNNVKMIKVDIDTISEKTANNYDVKAVPTTIIIKNKAVIKKVQGFMSEDQLTKLIDDNL